MTRLLLTSIALIGMLAAFAATNSTAEARHPRYHAYYGPAYYAPAYPGVVSAYYGPPAVSVNVPGVVRVHVRNPYLRPRAAVIREVYRPRATVVVPGLWYSPY